MLSNPIGTVERRRLRLDVDVPLQVSDSTEEHADEWLVFNRNGTIRWMKTRMSRCCFIRAERWSRTENDYPVAVDSTQPRLDSTRPDPSEENPDECRWISYPDRLDSFRGKRHDPVRSLQTDPEYTNTIDVLIIVPARAMQQMGVEMRCCYSSGAERSNRHAIG